MTFHVRDAQAEEALRNIGRKVKNEMLPPGYGFALLVFDLGKEGGMFYMSSAERTSMIEAMKEFIANAEKENVRWTGSCGAPIYENGKIVGACAVMNCQTHR